VADTLLARLSSTISRSTTREIASHLNESDSAVSRAMELSMAAVLGGLSRKAGEPAVMSRIIDVAAKTDPNALASGISGGQLNPGSTLMSSSARLLSSLFGDRQDRVLDSIARGAGLPTASAAAMLAVAAQAVMSFIGTRVRDERLTPNALAGLLQREGPGLRQSLPAGFDEAFTPRLSDRNPVRAQAADDPVVAQSVVRRRRSLVPWLLPAAAAALAVFWLGRPPREIVAELPPPPPLVVGTTGALIPVPESLGDFLPRTLRDGTTLRIPERGVEGRLLAFIEDPDVSTDSTTWFDFDRLLFDTGSARLRPESQEQLRDVAAILKAHPNVNLKIGGYTDNVGSAGQNLTLSQQRASNVRQELVRLGVAPNRLAAEGYGQEHPVADNSTEAGRELNRRISMRVTQK
jgi:outer membrane protein OmpA-like peptidoglycan-associated protein